MDDGTLGVYVHVPFCERICPYCDFAVVRARTLAAELESAYVGALAGELAQRREAFAPLRLATIYLGGGTPALLRPESIAQILESIGGAFVNAPRVEVTLEVNPSTVERSRLPAFREAGVNRLSLGVQSFDDPVLRRLGRAHRAEEGLATLAACRAAGFENLSLDLIYAVPGQGLESYRRDLDEVAKQELPHLSTYALTVEPGTPYAYAVERGILTLPSEEESVAMFEEAERRLAAVGLERYELSSYARPGYESRHNRRYWERRPVLGLGMGAWSSDPARAEAPFGTRTGNVRALGIYLERIAEGKSPAERSERLDEVAARGEAVFLALRTARGLDAGGFEREFGGPPRRYYAEPIDALCEAALMREEPDGSLRLTARGRLLSDSVFAHFV